MCLTVSPVTVTAGGTLTFSASGFENGQTVTAVVASREIVLGRFTADATGTLTEKTVTIPSRITAGYHTFKLIARNPSRELTARIKVLRDEDGDSHHHGHSGGGHGHYASDSHGGSGEQGSHHQQPPSLAQTGSEKAMALVGAAGALVVMGAGTVVAARRRRSS
ncbi:LPXTG cell wall anchor domain-containing protein [Streptomyces sp. MK7]|uniref:LPXTG cell wall anchor domain-containing protein n=1 Tax=Streptomyces sp. MK7 TaxID=3067635 RepID=UPI0029304FFC|nr:LPXTG cell wall anchor domain-containing protein [Streptomyces sp. MK7]